MDIIVFACNWSGLSCVEAASHAGLEYPSSVKVVRVNCLSRIHSGLILKALELGADGVMLLGCQPGNCHFGFHTRYNTQEYEKVRQALRLLGMGEERLMLTQLTPGDGTGFVNQVTSFMRQIENSVIKPAIPG